MQFDEVQDTVKLISFHSSKGLEFPLVAIPAVPIDATGVPREEQRLLYVAMTRATQTLIVTTHGQPV